MTYYEWIRACLMKDAEQHPYPRKGCGQDLPSSEQNEERGAPDEGTDP